MAWTARTVVMHRRCSTVPFVGLSIVCASGDVKTLKFVILNEGSAQLKDLCKPPMSRGNDSSGDLDAAPFGFGSRARSFSCAEPSFRMTLLVDCEESDSGMPLMSLESLTWNDIADAHVNAPGSATV